MTLAIAIIIYIIWIAITLGLGAVINWLFGMTAIPTLTTACGILVFILEVISILVGLITLLIYIWSTKVTCRLECKISNMNKTMKRRIKNFKQTKDGAIKKTKDWYDGSWFAVEDINNTDDKDN